REISWDHLKTFLPEHRPATAGDLGCGTGWFGMRLAKSGFDLVFLDPSGGMLARSRENLEALGRKTKARYVQAGLEDMGELEDECLDFATAQGDPLSFCKQPRRGLAELRRILKPGACCVLSVDHRVAGLKTLAQGKKPGPMLDLLKTGRTEWKAHRSEDSFPMKMFDAQELQALAAKTGFETLSLIGKTCLVQRSNESWLEDPVQRRQLKKAEEEVHGRPSYLGLASHLQIALRRR
ncbi:MAG TPA: methyltransferase domain-containing protein, partial [Planctomycetes bacterium]|nr:methyltransferase domain-containing protein [Planctomycetota bacterium]